MSDKPSRNEDEYFAREDAERIRKLREQDATARAAEERRSHFMKCPKCGATLQAETFHGITVDRCPECQGLWFDAGEVELIMKHQDPGVFKRVLGDVTASLKRLRAR